MANTFLRKVQNDALSTGSQIYIVPAATTTVIIGFILSNTSDVNIKVNADAAGVDIIGKDTVIPAASALSVLDGKLVLQEGDIVNVTPDTDAACDVIMSIMEIT